MNNATGSYRAESWEAIYASLAVSTLLNREVREASDLRLTARRVDELVSPLALNARLKCSSAVHTVLQDTTLHVLPAGAPPLLANTDHVIK